MPQAIRFSSAPIVRGCTATPPRKLVHPGFFFSRIHPDDHASVAEAHKAFLAGHGVFDEEFRIQRKDGQWIWVHDRAVASYEKDGKLYTDGMISDITERKAMEESLRESEERYRRLFEVESDAILVVDSDTGRILDANAAALRVYGYSREEFLLLTVEEVSAEPEKTRAAIVDYPTRVQLRWHRKKDGTVFPVEITNNYFVSQGRKVHVAAIRDITERQRAEKELRLTQFSVEHASDAIFWMDPQGRIVYVNEAACRSLGRSREELLSLSIPDIDPLFPKEAWEAFWEELKPRGSMTFETQHQTKEGRVFPVEITANYLEFDGKEYSFAFARDITERKRAEEALRASESRYRLLFENNVAATIRHTMDGRIVDCNAAAARTLGYESPQELLGLSMNNIRWDSEKRVEMIARLQAGETVAGVELEVPEQGWHTHLVDRQPYPDSRRRHRRNICARHLRRYHRAQADRGSAACKRSAVPAIGGDDSRGLLCQYAGAGPGDLCQPGLRRNLGQAPPGGLRAP